MNLVFVYNADSGIFNTLTDIAHKIISPDTYQCNLCNLTHSYFTTRDAWIKFLDEIDAEIEFLHRDEYRKKYASTDEAINLPAIFLKDGEVLKLWLDNKVISEMQSTDELMEMIRAAILRQQSGTKDADEILSLPV